MPIHGSSRWTGVSTTAKASRPHGIPLNGQPLRTTSAAVQAAAAHTGHQRRVGPWEVSTATAAPARP